MLALALSFYFSAVIDINGYGKDYEQMLSNAAAKACGKAYGINIERMRDARASFMCTDIEYTLLQSSEDLGGYRKFKINVADGHPKYSGDNVRAAELSMQYNKNHKAMANKIYRRSLATALSSVFDNSTISVKYTVDINTMVSYDVRVPMLPELAADIADIYGQGFMNGNAEYIVYFIISVRLQCSSTTAMGYIGRDGKVKYVGFVRNKPDIADNTGVSGRFVLNNGSKSCQYTDIRKPVIKIAFAVSNDNDASDRISNLTSCLVYDTQDKFTIYKGDKNYGYQDLYEKISAYNCDSSKVALFDRYTIDEGAKMLTYSVDVLR
jgi:hypothetical protein